MRISLDPSTRRIDGGRALVGGTPLRVLRLTDAGARLLDRLEAGDPVPDSPAARRLVDRLVDAGAAHPVPDAPGPFSAADVAVVVPVRGEPVTVDPGAVGAVVVVHDDEGRGPSAARNTGWRQVTQPLVAFVDADVELPAGWLTLLLAHLADPAVAAVAPRVRSTGDAAPPWLAAYESVRSPLDLGPRPAPVRPGSRVPYVPTAALVVRRDALDAVGGFDEALRTGEDVDLVWRLTTAGWRVRYEPAVEVRHPARPTLAAWVRQRVAYGSSAAPLTERHGDAVAPLGISGWSALAWGGVLARRPRAGLGVAAGTTAALAPKLRNLEHPAREAVRIAGLGHLHAGRAVADALWRPWWPLTLLLATVSRRARLPLAAALAVPVALDWRARRPPMRPAAFAALRVADDLAYGAGVWLGCLRRRSFRALRPRFTGPFPRPRGT